MLTDESMNGNGRSYSGSSLSSTYAESQLEELLTIEDVSKLLKVPKSWVYEHTRKRGMEKLPYVKLGK